MRPASSCMLQRCQRETGAVWCGCLACLSSAKPALPAENRRGVEWRGASRSAIRFLPLPQTLQASPEKHYMPMSPEGATKWSRRPAALTGMIGYKADACPAHGWSVSGDGALPLRCWQKTGAVCRAMQRPVSGLASGMVRQSVTKAHRWSSEAPKVSSPSTANFRSPAPDRRVDQGTAWRGAELLEARKWQWRGSAAGGGADCQVVTTGDRWGGEAYSNAFDRREKRPFAAAYSVRRQQFPRLRGRRGRSGLYRCTVGA